MKDLKFKIVAIFLAAMLISCAKPSSTAPEVTKVEPIKPVARADWEIQWQKTLDLARKEGRVVVYGGSAAAALKTYATKLIKQKFGFDLEVITASGSEVRARVSSERRSGLFVADVYASGASEIYESFKPMGAVDPLEPVLMLPEVLDQSLWYGGKLPWSDEGHKTIIWAGHPATLIAINTNLVQPREINSFYDLLNRKWKGKIVINDPLVGSGQAFYSFNAMIYNKMVDLDFFHQLIREQEMTMLRDQHLQIIWLAQGKFPVAIWPSTGRMEDYRQTAPYINWLVTKEGLHLSGGGAAIAIMNKAPHSNAATIFINWLLSKEGQLILQNGTGKQTLRTDVPHGLLDPTKVRQPDIKYFPDPNSIEKFVLEEYPRNLDIAKDIFGTLLR